jgi:hypothetical protein
LLLQPEPYRKAPMTTALLTYTTSGDTTDRCSAASLQSRQPAQQRAGHGVLDEPLIRLDGGGPAIPNLHKPTEQTARAIDETRSVLRTIESDRFVTSVT